MLRSITEALALLRAINHRTYNMALDLTELKNTVVVLSGNITTLISIARAGNQDPTAQAAIDAIEKSLEAVNTAVAQADADLAPPPGTGPAGTPGATGTDTATGTTGATGA